MCEWVWVYEWVWGGWMGEVVDRSAYNNYVDLDHNTCP